MSLLRQSQSLLPFSSPLFASISSTDLTVSPKFPMTYSSPSGRPRLPVPSLPPSPSPTPQPGRQASGSLCVRPPAPQHRDLPFSQPLTWGVLPGVPSPRPGPDVLEQKEGENTGQQRGRVLGLCLTPPWGALVRLGGTVEGRAAQDPRV